MQRLGICLAILLTLLAFRGAIIQNEKPFWASENILYKPTENAHQNTHFDEVS